MVLPPDTGMVSVFPTALQTAAPEPIVSNTRWEVVAGQAGEMGGSSKQTDKTRPEA